MNQLDGLLNGIGLFGNMVARKYNARTLAAYFWVALLLSDCVCIVEQTILRFHLGFLLFTLILR